MKLVTLLPGIAAVALLCLGGLGCKGRYTAYCEDKMSCVNGNDADIDACKADLEGQEAVADAYACTDDYDSWWTCEEDRAMCYRDPANTMDLWGSRGDCDHDETWLGDCQFHSSDLIH